MQNNEIFMEKSEKSKKILNENKKIKNYNENKNKNKNNKKIIFKKK